jgi:nucleoid-associated protein YgaU
MAYRGYQFYIDKLQLPYAPSELKVTIGSNNQTVELISGNEINILKNPKLTEIEFEIELPRGRQYAFANKLESPIKFTDYFEKLKLNKQPVKLVVVRTPPNGSVGNTLNGFASSTWTVSLEDYTLTESADNAYDIIVSLKFKEYISYGTVKKTVTNTSTMASTVSKVTTVNKKVQKNKNYTVKKGDTLCKISRKFYGNANKWKTIYKANKSIIEKTAKKYGKKSSSNGHWIYPKTKLVIPKS